jgi:hypothetical protein
MQKKTRWLAGAILAAAALAWMGDAAAQSPTVQELLAEQDQLVLKEVAWFVNASFVLPDDLPLDTALREAATEMAKAHMKRVWTQLPQWIAQERAAAGNPGLRGSALSHPLYFRAINEMALWSIESAGPTNDKAWIQAALAPMACDYVYDAIFARRIAMIQAAPVEVRPTLLEGERQLLSHWGSKRENLPERPAAAQFSAADQVITRLRAGLPVEAVPMSAFLAKKIFARERKPNQSDRWEQCAKNQWWLASQLDHGNTDRTQALTLYRYSRMEEAQPAFLPADVAQKLAAKLATGDKSGYSPAASYYQVEGVTAIEVELDDQGKFMRAKVASRKLKVPGVRDNPPIAFETLLDAAALDYAEKGRSYPADKGKNLKFEMNWRLDGEKK